MKMKNLTKRILVALALGIFAFQPNTQALPTGLQSEDAKQITADNVMNVIGQNQNNVLNWQSFNIAAGETVNFTNALNYLNLVRGYDMSRIYGTMNGDGNIILINPNGILFGAGANINVGSLYASTRGIDDGVINQFKADGTIGALGLGKSADGNITMALANVKNADSVVLEGNRVVIQDLSQMKDIKMIDAKKVGIGSKTGSLKDTDGSFTTYNAAVDGKLTLHQTEFGYLKDGKVDTTPADYNISDHNNASDDYHAVSAYKTIDSASELGAIQGTSNASHYMLTKDIAPTIALTTTPVDTTLNEKGTTVTDVTVSANITVGTAEFAAGANVIFKKDGVAISTQPFTVDTLTYTYTDTGANLTDNTTYSVELEYTLAENTATLTDSKIIKFALPMYYGISATDTVADVTTLTKIVSDKGSQNVTYTADNEYCVFAVPSTKSITSLKDVNGFENVDSWATSTQSVTVGADSVEYKVYVTNTPVTCSNFVYTVKLS